MSTTSQDPPAEPPASSWQDEQKEDEEEDEEEEGRGEDGGDDNSSLGPPPPPPRTPHPEDKFLNTTLDTNDLFYDEETPRRNDPPQVSPNSKDDSEDSNDDEKGLPHGAPYVDWEDDESVEIPPTKIVKRWNRRERRMLKRKNNDESAYVNQDDSQDQRTDGFLTKIIASVACCVVILVIILGAGFGSGAFLSEESSAVAPPTTVPVTSAPTTPTDPDSPAPATAPPVEAPTAAPVDDSTVNRPSAFQELLAGASFNPEAFDDVQSAESLAANWLISSDPLQLDPENPADQFRIQQRYALLTQYFAADGSWTNEEGWLTEEDECTWNGILCEEVTVDGGNVQNAVVTVNLAANNIGTITPDIAMLNRVTSLNLSGNPWAGGFPTQVTNMPQLRILELEDLGLTDDISSVDFSVFQNLEVLRLRGNSLSGSLDSFYSMTSLVEVQASGGNNISVEITPDIANMVNLQVLDFNGCSVTGELVEEMGSLTSLTTVDLGRPAPSPTEGVTGTIPASIRQLTQLSVLDLFGNRLTGAIPDMTGVPLQVLRLSNNDFDTAPIPDFVYTLTGLIELSMANCKLTGSIGPSIGNLTLLRVLALDANFLSGALPNALDQLQQLERLTLSFNIFEAALPATLVSLTNLQVLDLTNSRLIGPLPFDLGNMVSLRELRLSENRLTGAIPVSLTRLVLLEEIELNTNGLSGRVPFAMGALFNLRILRLHDNTRGAIPGSGLIGQIPPSLGNLRNLQQFEIYDNFMTGPLPTEMGGLTTLQLLDIEFNGFTGVVPDTFQGMVSLQSFYLSGNSFTPGQLPESLCSIETLTDLVSDCDLTNSCSRCPN